MSLVLSQTRSGLHVAEHGSDERTVSMLLRTFDPGLVLSKEVDPIHGCFVYVVVKRQGDRSAVHICDWRDELGNPLPLASSLVDKVKSLHADSRAPRVDVLALNDNLRANQERDLREELYWHAKEALRLGNWGHTSEVRRGPAYAAARRRARRRGEQ
jgi:hypothetical protein